MRTNCSAALSRALIAVVLVSAACSGRPTPHTAGYFRVAILVDTTSDPVSRERAEAVIVIANEKMLDLTGFGLQMVDFVEDSSGASIAGLVANYMNSHAGALPNGILVFSVGDDDRAKVNRAYAQQIAAPANFRNAFVSPYLGAGYMYIAILQFNHRYAACGYAGTDTEQGSVSSQGECRGVDGEVCVPWNGMSVCESAMEFLEGHTPVDLAAGPVIHEFMHAFSDRGPDDHYGTEACNKAMGWQPDHYDLEESVYYSAMCPDVYDIFSDSYHP